MTRTLAVQAAALALFGVLVSTAVAEQSRIVLVDPDPVGQGDIVKVVVAAPVAAPAGTLTIAGRSFTGFPIGGLMTFFVGVDLDVEPSDTVIETEVAGFKGRHETRVVAKSFGRESLKVSPTYTDLDEKTLVRVKAEQERLKAIWATNTPQRLWTKSFVKPAAGELGSPFGLRRFFNGQPRSPHSGMDIRAQAGSEVYASNSGRVVLADDLFFTGNTVIIDHGLGLYTIYAHLSQTYVEAGGQVERSKLIGRVGATGRVTGPHLHWAVKLGGARVDPSGLPGVLL